MKVPVTGTLMTRERERRKRRGSLEAVNGKSCPWTALMANQMTQQLALSLLSSMLLLSRMAGKSQVGSLTGC